MKRIQKSAITLVLGLVCIASLHRSAAAAYDAWFTYVNTTLPPYQWAASPDLPNIVYNQARGNRKVCQAVYDTRGGWPSYTCANYFTESGGLPYVVPWGRGYAQNASSFTSWVQGNLKRRIY
jgi:hypothetical protein